MKVKTLVVCFAVASIAAAQEEAVQHHVTIARAGGEAGQMISHADTITVVSAEAGVPGRVVKGAPYTAEAITESTQTLADGNRIARKSTAQLARDSEGRTRRQDRFGESGSATTKEANELVFISDPVAKVSWTLETGSRTARKMSTGFAEVREGGFVGSVVHVPGGASAKTMQLAINSERHSETGKSESLGKRNIEGVIAEGTRITRTIPAGEIGNERPIEIVSERWYSPELQMVVLSKRTDPMMGETTYRLTNIVRSEPPRSLFEPPADYQVKESAGDLKVIRTVKK